MDLEHEATYGVDPQLRAGTGTSSGIKALIMESDISKITCSFGTKYF